jgi:hypothetical protein
VHWSPAAKEAGGSLCNAWMMGKPGAPFVHEWLSRTHQSFNGSWDTHSTVLPFRISREHPEWIHIEPRRSFFYFDYHPRGICDIFKRRVPELGGIFSMHLWSHCWWDPKKRNSALFHGLRLTPAYVRYANATYASIARQFLPKDFGKQDISTWRRERLYATVENCAWLTQNMRSKLKRTFSRRGELEFPRARREAAE